VDAATLLDALDQAIAEATAEDRPGLIVALAARLAQLGAGLTVPTANGNDRSTEDAERWLSPEQAAELAKLPMAEGKRHRSLKRLYAWAKGKPWASNPTGRYLRIHERRFRAWLATRRG
jgi:hypothetical protein